LTFLACNADNDVGARKCVFDKDFVIDNIDVNTDGIAIYSRGPADPFVAYISNPHGCAGGKFA